ncbi:LLM class F420-dependent oxidoreductase [Nocardia cyriacigeorgica]|uniref:LLM class F420-dependent oxidoreductase n=1 Tax=Nocardia cyriacigeorgica TaxID=135487 RepID=UPI002456D916|nr:LLM class F420-dependent oxidoreductase [Nocardia cyriacigeorgica]
MTIEGLGRFGAWRGYTGFTPEDAKELEELGYGTLWLGSSPPAELPVVEDLLAATETLHVGTSIVNIWTAPAAEVAASFHRIEARFPGRFLLGIGAGHPEFNGTYRKPYDALVEYLDELDEAGVPRSRRALAALGPRVLELAAERSAGALPYLVPPAHTAFARETLGPAGLVVEHKFVLDEDADRARATARPPLQVYLGLGNYVRNLRKFGFTESDVAAPGSDALVDALAVHGSAAAVAERLRAHLDAGADHIAVQPLGSDYLADLRALAPELIRPA